MQDEIASPDGFRHDDPEAFADYLRGDGPRPPDTPFYKALRSLVDRNHDGSFSEEELDRLLRNRHHADRLTRLIVRHETAWTRTSMRRHTETARRIAAKLGPAAVENVNAEEPRGEKLPWWEDVAAGVEGFPASSRVWHFHAGGVAGNLFGLADREIAWGLRVSPRFKSRAIEISDELGIPPDYLMSCMSRTISSKPAGLRRRMRRKVSGGSKPKLAGRAYFLLRGVVFRRPPDAELLASECPDIGHKKPTGMTEVGPASFRSFEAPWAARVRADA
ncbi:hypothetical protein ACFW0P_18010 [Lysobacter soli]|uniref:hypothetical protein n=1 Tax=Lysobacter soli TaxID=453783 RepID=UPI0036A373E5